MAPKKNVKMDLGSFLADDSYGGTSWADEEVDLNSIGLSLDKSTTEAPIGGKSSFSGIGGGESRFQEPRKERKEYPIPDKPPYVARVSNLPWEVSEEVIVRHFEDRMQAQDIITEVKLPVDRENGRLKGYAFVTFTERGLLEESLNLTLSDFQGRKIFVNVAAPPRADEGDWRSGRSGPLGGGREPEVDLDWGAARKSQAELPVRERSNRGPREHRPRDEPDFDWGAARSDSSGLPQRERSNRGPREHKPRDEPDLDWGAARSESSGLPPRERSNRGPREHKSRDEPELDWGSVRSSHADLPPRQRSSRTSSHGEGHERGSFKPRKQEPELDWGSARTLTTTLPPREKSNRSVSNRKNSENDFDWKRGQPLQQRTKPAHGQKHRDEKKEEDKPQGPQKSQYSVLSVDDGDDEEDKDDKEAEQEDSKQESESVSVNKLESATANLSVSDKDSSNDDWEVVGKK
ncbi:TIF3 [Candida theae]|uniref:TIF3 n=1 Tax=Candida theae TaxID=1198502 RepID=A0AAD5BIJ5_9ASCO|nr:TIF3 [Candida theae]KAI5964487.1 TIF3 [Candida theae]